MAPDFQLSLPPEIYSSIVAREDNAVSGILQYLLNEVMKLERESYLQAANYERSPNRQGLANGYKDKTVSTGQGKLELRIPQVRDSSFYPSSLEKGTRSEQSLRLAIAQMYLLGVSTRKVGKIVQELCGEGVSSTQVSRLTAKLDEQLEKFRARALGPMQFIYLDARYEKARVEGAVRDVAVLIATGTNEQGHREILGVSVSLSEAEVHWRAFMESLCKRGLTGVKLIVSDDHAGLKAARLSVFPSVRWQRCLFHLAQNAQAYVPKLEMREEIALAVKDIFNCSSRAEAEEKLKSTVRHYQGKASRFAQWLEDNAHEAMTFYDFDRSIWRKIRTTNSLERLNREIKRRTKVVSIFPNEASLLRLVTALLVEQHEEWVSGKRFLSPKEPLLAQATGARPMGAV